MAEHSHWHRQLRREAYDAFLAALYEVVEAVHAVIGVRADQAALDLAARELDRRTNTLQASGIRVELAGPDQVDSLAKEAFDALERLSALLVRDLQGEAVTEDINALFEEAGRKAEELSRAMRSVLREPPS
ncbi:hypothetical protein ACPCA8_14745 [Streptomyces capoamus]|uniref:hypothetical protein n=1 Tax=Streptomyces capoamus TaxID=68183 RepID=UPI003C2AF5CA